MERPREERKARDKQSHPNIIHQERVKERVRSDSLIRINLMQIAQSVLF